MTIVVTYHTRTRESQSEHDREVLRRYLQFLLDPAWTDVRADLPSAPKPGTFGGHVPDVTGRKNGTLYLLEVETADSYATAHAKSQYRAFAAAGEFILDVPESVELNARLLLAVMGIPADVWTY